MSTDEYYDVSPAHYQMVYRERLYPHLRPEQRIVLLPFAAYCEIGCQQNTLIAGPRPQPQNCSETPWGECWTGCPLPKIPKGSPWPCAGGVGPQPAEGSCNACVCNEHNTSCSGQGRQPYTADPRCLGSAMAHLAWAESDPKVIGLCASLPPLCLLPILVYCCLFEATALLTGLHVACGRCDSFIYRLKNLWQKTDMTQLDACQNPWGSGLGLVDRCGVGGSGGYATPQTLHFYQHNVSRALSVPAP
jgi:hypothetical protein